MAIRKIVNRANKSFNYTLPSPIGGLNARDSLDAMKENEAITMDNYIPSENKVILRNGFVTYVSTESEIKTLVEFKAESGQNRFFAFGGGELWDITSAQSPKKFELVLNNDMWQTAQFKNRLFAVNGQDEPLTFYLDEHGNGVWEGASFAGTNLLPATLVNVTSSKQRLWFVEKNSLKVWYSENAAEVQGNLLCFDLTTIARYGGYLVAVANWTQDGGQGMDDLTVFLTSEGEALVYSGKNPNSADDWTLKGSYLISKPLGYRCLMSYLGDIVVMTEDGYLPLSKALPLSSANSSQIAFSDKIRGLVLSRTAVGKDKFGWQSILYARGGYAIFNVPVNQIFEQHVVNLNTGAWCRFTNLNAFCWGIFNGRAYFGTTNGVMLFDESHADNRNPIEGKVEQAFSDFGTGALKKLQLLNPHTKSLNPYALTIFSNADFDSEQKPYTEQIGETYQQQTLWGRVMWSSLGQPSGTKWAVLQTSIRSQWIGTSATGFKFSLVFQTCTRGNSIEWYDTGLRFETGVGLL